MPTYVTNFPSDYFAIGKQTAKDTEASTFSFFRHKDGTGMDVEPDVQSEREAGDGQEVGLRYKSLLKADGGISGNVRPQFAAQMFAGALGNTATVGLPADFAEAPSGCQLHRFTPAATIPWFTVDQRFADEVERVTNVKITTLDLEGEAGRPARLTAELISAGTAYQRDVASVLTVARESADVIFFPRGSYTITGASGAHLTKFKLSVKRSLDDGVQTTELWRDDLPELNQDFDLDGTLKYVDRTLHQRAIYGGGSQVAVRLGTGTFDAVMTNTLSGTVARRLRVCAPIIEFLGSKVNKLDPDGKTVYLDFVAATVKNATNPVFAEIVVPSQAATFT